jgi:hypothetical protein
LEYWLERTFKDWVIDALWQALLVLWQSGIYARSVTAIKYQVPITTLAAAEWPAPRDRRLPSRLEEREHGVAAAGLSSDL